MFITSAHAVINLSARLLLLCGQAIYIPGASVRSRASPYLSTAPHNWQKGNVCSIFLGAGGEGRAAFLATLLPESGLRCCGWASQEQISIANQDLGLDKPPAIPNDGTKGARHYSKYSLKYICHIFCGKRGQGRKDQQFLIFPTSMFL